MSDGQKLFGQEFHPRKNLSFPFWEMQLDYEETAINEKKTGSEGAAAADISPTDVAAAKIRQYDIAAFVAAALAQTPITIPGYTRVGALPNVLHSVTIEFNGAEGTGAGNHPASQMAASISDGGSATLGPRSKAQASASIVPLVWWDLEQPRNKVVPCINHYFYLSSPVTEADVLTKIGGGVVALPNFKPKERQLVAKGAQVSVQQSADTTISKSENAHSTEYGDDNSKEVGTNGRIETIPESLHAALTLAGNTSTKTATVTVDASTPAVDGVVSAISNAPTAISGVASASVTFNNTNTIPATSPTDIPRTGSYLTEINGQVDDVGLVLIQAVVVNMIVYA